MAKANYIKIAKKSAAVQISELRKVNKIFNKNFVKAIDLISASKGKIIAAGIGKSGLIARKKTNNIPPKVVTIDKNGLVISAKVIDSSGHKDIDDASISAAMKSIFLPISEASTITIKYEHKIK